MKYCLALWRENRQMVTALIKNDFRARYSGSSFGIFWGFLQPVITVLVYWFVFSVGLRSGARPDGTPYILWLVCGMVPWFFFSEALGAVSNAFIEYGYLVKKVQFRLGFIPVIKIGSALIVHAVFLAVVTVILNFYGFRADWYYLQLLYYLAVSVALLLGLGLGLAAITVFFRDMAQIVGIVIQIGFWAIPIVWGSELLSPTLQKVFKLNPVFYIVEGYRESLLNGVPFWAHPWQSAYVLVLTGLVLFLGLRIFRKLRGNFADVL